MTWRDLMCGDVRPEHIGRRVSLAGWANTRRDHGGLVFVDLRDRAGICQIVVNPERAAAAVDVAHELRNEFVIRAEGDVVARAPELVNPNLATGEIEVQVDSLEIVSIKEARVRRPSRHRRRPPNFPAAVGRTIHHVFRSIFH